MPRRRQPLTPQGQAYGEKGRLDNALNETPGARDIGSASGAGGGPVPVPHPAPPGGIPPQVLQAAQMMAPPGPSPWKGDSQRPNEPITTGLSIGDGAGPEALVPMRPDHVADTFAAIGDATGDPLMYDLAQRARHYKR